MEKIEETVEQFAKRAGWNIQQVLEVEANNWIDAKPLDEDIDPQEAFIAGWDKGNANGKIIGYTTRNDEVVKMVDEFDSEDGKTNEFYKGYFACKNEILTKLKEDKK